MMHDSPVAVEVVHPAERSDRSWLQPAVAAVLFVAISAVANHRFLRTSRVEEGDLAADSLRTLTWWQQTTGIYSRWDFHHPGPSLFWLKALGNAIPGLSPLAGQMLIHLAVVAAAVGLLSWVLHSVTGSRIVIWAAFPLAVIVGDGSELLPWGPATAHWFVLLSVAALSAWRLGCVWGGPVALAAALIAAQMHLMYVPVGIALAALAMWLARSGWRWNLIGCVVLVPMLIGVISGDSYWSAYFDSSGGGMVRDWRMAVVGVAESVTPLARPRYIVGSEAAARDLWAALIVAAMVAAAIWVLKRRRFDPVGVQAALGLGFLAYMLAVSRTALLQPTTAGPAAAVMLMLPAVALINAPKISERVLGAASIALLVLFAAEAPEPSGVPDQAFAEYRAVADGRPLIIDYSNQAYVPAAGLMLLAQRNGIDACLAKQRWPHWTDDVCEPDASGVRVVFDGDGYTIS